MFALAILAPACGDSEDAPLARIVEHGDGTRREVALTFDAGIGGSTDPESVAEILHLLRERGVRATFALTGRWAEENRDLLFTIAADGHQIINGTYDGTSWTGASTGGSPLTPAERKLELSRAEVTVYRYTSRTTRPYFRPPHGDIDEGALRDAAANGFPVIVMWTIDLRGLDAAAIAERAGDGASPGTIIALDASAEAVAALPRIIDGKRASGDDFETVKGILEAGPPD